MFGKAGRTGAEVPIPRKKSSRNIDKSMDVRHGRGEASPGNPSPGGGLLPDSRKIRKEVQAFVSSLPLTAIKNAQDSSELASAVSSRLYRSELGRMEAQSQLEDWMQVAAELKHVVQQQQEALEAQLAGSGPAPAGRVAGPSPPPPARPLSPWNGVAQPGTKIAALEKVVDAMRGAASPSAIPAPPPPPARGGCAGAEPGDLGQALAAVAQRLGCSPGGGAEGEIWEAKALELELRAARREAARAQETEAGLRRALGDAETEGSRLDERLAAARAALAEAEARLEGEAARGREARGEAEAARGEAARLRARLDELEAAMRGVKEESEAAVAELRGEAAGLRVQLERLRDEAGKAEAERARLEGEARCLATANAALGADLAAAVAQGAEDRRAAEEREALASEAAARAQRAQREAREAGEAARAAAAAADELEREAEGAREEARRAQRAAARHAAAAATAQAEVAEARSSREGADARCVALQAALEAARGAGAEAERRVRAAEEESEALARRARDAELATDRDTEVRALRNVLDRVTTAAQAGARELEEARHGLGLESEARQAAQAEAEHLRAELLLLAGKEGVGVEEDRKDARVAPEPAADPRHLSQLLDLVSGLQRSLAERDAELAAARARGAAAGSAVRMSKRQAHLLRCRAGGASLASSAEGSVASRAEGGDGEEEGGTMYDAEARVRDAEERTRAAEAQLEAAMGEVARLQALAGEVGVAQARERAAVERLEACQHELEACRHELDASREGARERGAAHAQETQELQARLERETRELVATQALLMARAGGESGGSATSSPPGARLSHLRASGEDMSSNSGSGGMQEALASYEQALQSEKAATAKALEELQARHEEELAALRLEQEQRLQEVELGYLAELEEAQGLQQQRDSAAALPGPGLRASELAQLKEEHAAQLSAQRAKHAAQVSELEAALTALRSQVEALVASDRGRGAGGERASSAATTPRASQHTAGAESLRLPGGSWSAASSPARCRITSGSQGSTPLRGGMRGPGSPSGGSTPGAASPARRGAGGEGPADVRRLAAQLEACQEECERRGAALAECQDMVDELQAFAEQKKAEAAQLAEALEGANAGQRELGSRLRASEALLAEAQAAAAAAASRVERAERRAAALGEELAALRQMHDALQSEHTGACGQLAATQTGHELAMRQIADLAAQLATARAEAASAAAEAARAGEPRARPSRQDGELADYLVASLRTSISEALGAAPGEARAQELGARPGDNGPAARGGRLESDEAAAAEAAVEAELRRRFTAMRGDPPPGAGAGRLQHFPSPSVDGTPRAPGSLTPACETPHSAMSQETSWSDTVVELAPSAMQRKKSKGALHKLAKMLRGGGRSKKAKEAAAAAAAAGPTLHRLSNGQTVGFLGPQVAEWEARQEAAAVAGGDRVGQDGAEAGRGAPPHRLSTLHEVEEGEASTPRPLAWYRNDLSVRQDADPVTGAGESRDASPIQPPTRGLALKRAPPLLRTDAPLVEEAELSARLQAWHKGQGWQAAPLGDSWQLAAGRESVEDLAEERAQRYSSVHSNALYIRADPGR
ncbi:hypothetical protein ACKKBG_A17325 [Auxenochlorella protothecoides x Auxenochlorella symbiontica]